MREHYKRAKCLLKYSYRRNIETLSYLLSRRIWLDLVIFISYVRGNVQGSAQFEWIYGRQYVRSQFTYA